MTSLHLVAEPAADDDPRRARLVQHLVDRRLLGEQADVQPARAAALDLLERVRAQTTLLVVREPGLAAHRGHVWSVHEGDDLTVLDLVLDDEALAPVVRASLERRAREVGARRLVVETHPGDAAVEALVLDGGFAVSAVQMRLDLGRDLPEEDGVHLAAMGESSFAAWEAGEVEAYAAERALAGESVERAREVSREQHAQLLPEGRRTAGQHFFSAVVAGDDGPVEVGTLWVSTTRPMAFVYDVEVDEPHRRRGHGAAILRAAALWSREQGAHALGLNVFGHNHTARSLYDRLGFVAVETLVAKDVST